MSSATTKTFKLFPTSLLRCLSVSAAGNLRPDFERGSKRKNARKIEVKE
jgi:hypothetical protein